MIDRSKGSPGHTAQWSNRDEHMACPCVKARRSVSKPKRVNGRQERLDRIKRRARFGGILHDVASSTSKHRIHGLHAVGRALDVH